MLKRKLFLKIALLIIFLSAALAAAYYFLFRQNLLNNLPPFYFNILIIDIALIYLIITYFFITKPFNIILGEIKALLTGRKYNKIFTERVDEIGVVAHFFNQITKSLEGASKDIKDRRRMSHELDVARKIQLEILPKIVPQIPDLTIIAKNKSAAEIGGDCFDFHQGKDNSYFFIADVTGHGVPSGLVMMMAHTLVMTFANMFGSGYEVLHKTNTYLKPLLNSIMFITMTMLRWNHLEKKLYITGAGHEHIVIYKTKDRKCVSEKSGGIALAMVPDNSKIIQEREADFQPGDILILYTDGITEAKNIYGELFGLNRLITIIEEHAAKKTTEELFDIISEELKKFQENQAQQDDMSLILCKYGQEQFVSEEIKSINWS